MQIREFKKATYPMDLIVKTPHLAEWNGREIPCSVGFGGIVSAAAKKEGDGGTPVGKWKMREVFYRADRMEKPQTCLPIRALQQDDGWCEVPEDKNYNKLVKHPYPAAVDKLWRADNLYDVIIVLGFNDDPVRSGKGSAIFLHLNDAKRGTSAGCVRLDLPDILKILQEADENSCVEVRPA